MVLSFNEYHPFKSIYTLVFEDYGDIQFSNKELLKIARMLQSEFEKYLGYEIDAEVFSVKTIGTD